MVNPSEIWERYYELSPTFSAAIPAPGRLPMNSSPPDGQPIYRLLTGKDDSAFCQRVSEALALGYMLYGSPSITHNGEHAIVAQAVVWKDS
jgi:hypothetical protein